MIEMILHTILLLGMIGAAILVFTFKDLVSAAIAFGAFSFILALEFYLLQAPDVAIAEAAIGAGLSTAAFMIAIRGTSRKERDEA
ncbi:MAG: DUF4040 domain-containing protein [Methanocalculus sp.]|nr:hydrogenase subunit MbhD domain-containing protein [Methanocalculus sp.]MDO8842384.1 DUF4040 domain-containing protein [Methanocalculus sp.]MDO9538484.1 DUF4040 domain-containing protein [Methanocalculus sp.]